MLRRRRGESGVPESSLIEAEDARVGELGEESEVVVVAGDVLVEAAERLRRWIWGERGEGGGEEEGQMGLFEEEAGGEEAEDREGRKGRFSWAFLREESYSRARLYVYHSPCELLYRSPISISRSGKGRRGRSNGLTHERIR